VSLTSSIKKSLGILPQEYVCVALEDMPDRPSVFMTTRGSSAVIDVTSRHLFLGYKPLLIAIPPDDAGGELQSANQICLSFTHGEFKPGEQWRGFNSHANSIARLQLSQMTDDLKFPGLSIFAGEFGEQSFLPTRQALANKLVDALSRKPASEANVTGNLYEQVRIAYCSPRPISVITVKDDDLQNFFPTDLHGSLGSEFYLSSLRVGGMACEQVEHVRRLVISKVDVTSFRKTYSLGRNHMKTMQPVTCFEPAVVQSASGIPVYPHATSYCELELIRHIDIGIHRIFLYKTQAKGEVRSGKTLAHIHRYYAQWRINHHLSAEYFFR